MQMFMPSQVRLVMSSTQGEATLSSMTTKQMLSLWWREKWVRGLVLALSPIGFIDALYTFLLVQTHGPEYEYNPLVRFALTSELWILWIIIDILSFAIFAMIAGSYYIHTRSSIFGQHKAWLAGLIALRVGAVIYNVLLYYGDMAPIFWGIVGGILTFFAVGKLLTKDRDISVKGFKRYWRAKYDRIHDRILLSGIKVPKERMEQREYEIVEETLVSSKRVWMKRAGYISIAIIVFVSIPFVLTTIGIMTGGIYWNEYFGGSFFWNQLSGTTFVIGFFAVIVLISIIMYLLMNAFHTTEGAW